MLTKRVGIASQLLFARAAFSAAASDSGQSGPGLVRQQASLGTGYRQRASHLHKFDTLCRRCILSRNPAEIRGRSQHQSTGIAATILRDTGNASTCSK